MTDLLKTYPNMKIIEIKNVMIGKKWSIPSSQDIDALLSDPKISDVHMVVEHDLYSTPTRTTIVADRRELEQLTAAPTESISKNSSTTSEQVTCCSGCGDCVPCRRTPHGWMCDDCMNDM